jgi:ATP-binding cassette subfamily F protein 3
VANTIIEVNDGHATVYPGDFEYYAAKRGVDIEERGAVEGGRSTPRGVVSVQPKAREPARAAAARKRRVAEERNARHRRTRHLRAAQATVEADAAAAERELAELSDRLADPATYADASLVRELVERHNTLLYLTDALAAEHARLTDELDAAEAAPSPVAAR